MRASKTMTKIETTQESNPVKETKQTKPFFDGYIDILDPNIDGTYSTRREKFYLSDTETEEFMGGNDPFKYWRQGRAPAM